jgi:hypothetical protein
MSQHNNKHHRFTMFSKIQLNTAFSPAPGEIGATKVYVKKENGVCPQVGTKEFGVFWPEDRVIAVSVPKHLLEKHV